MSCTLRLQPIKVSLVYHDVSLVYSSLYTFASPTRAVVPYSISRDDPQNAVIYTDYTKDLIHILDIQKYCMYG
jgi:hypothetical protein